MSARSRPSLGLAVVLLSSVLFSAKAVLVKLAYPHGVDALTLVALRMGFALPFFVALAWHAGRSSAAPRMARRDRLAILALGGGGYYAASYLDFAGLAYTSAGLERLVLFAYPTLTVLLTWALFGTPPRRAELAALALSYAGIGLALVGEGARSGPHVLRGTLLVALGALAYAAYLVGSGRMIARLGTTRVVAGCLASACVAALAHFALARGMNALALPPVVYAYGLALALLSTVAPTLLLGHGMRLLGATQAAIASTAGPVSTLILAWIFLGERIGALQLAGTALVVAGVLVLGRGAPAAR